MIFENMDRIVFAGDSVTDMDRERPVGEGLFESLGHGYVRVVENMLSAWYPERLLRVTNMGCSGNTSRDLLKRFANDILPLRADWLVICIGVNDVWRQFDSPAMPDTHVGLAEYETNVEKMIAAGLENTKGVIVMSPYYMEPCREDPMRRRMDEYGAVCRKLAEKYACRFVDLQAMFDSYFRFRHSSYISWDRVHPNQIGATLIAREFLRCCGFDPQHKAGTEESSLQEILEAYDFGAPVVGAVKYGCGHINDTYCVHTQPEDDACRSFILQRMSSAAFKHPDQLMQNIVSVTEYLERKITACGGDRDREALRVIRTKTGASYYSDSTGNAWRVYDFVKNTACYQKADTPELFAASGRAFGRFQRMLDGYPAETLFETIPDFHNTEDRFARLKAAVEADRLGRVKDCAEEIRFAFAREKDCSVAMQAQRDGVLPLRVTHNDTKLNNVLFDKATGEGICVIDLDTVMPGLSINDFGDSIRFGANHCAEDEKNLDNVYIDLALYESYASSYVEGAEGILTDAELRYMPWGAKLMTLECGMRFLTDYLDGDRYFHISREGQNLDRCRTQFKLVSDMEQHWDEMNGIIEKLRRG